MIAAAVLLALFLVGTPVALYAETRRIAAHRRDDGASGRAGLWRVAVRVTRFPRSYARLWWGLLAGACVILYAREGTPASGAAGLVCLGVWGFPPGPFDGLLLRYLTGRAPVLDPVRGTLSPPPSTAAEFGSWALPRCW